MTRCPVCWAVAIDCDHSPVTLAAARRRNAAIGEAARRFGEVRDILREKLSGESFRVAIGPHEQAYDAAWREADATYRKDNQ